MIDRETVINELVFDIENALSGDSDFVYCIPTDLLQCAVALLKEQEPRVMTLEEVREWKQPDVWIENDKANFIGDYIEPAGRMEFAFLSSIVVGNKKHPDGTPITMDEQYGKKWRCWTARPTDKQREETPWEK